MTGRAPDPQVAQLAFDVAQDRVASQRASVDELRSRASGLLGAAAIATSFLAGFALDNRKEALNAFSWLGFFATAAIVVLLLLVLWPGRDWRFGHDPKVVVDAYYKGIFDGSKGPLSIEETQVYIAKDMTSWIEGNADRLNRMFVLFRWAVVAVGGMVTFWIADLLVLNL